MDHEALLLLTRSLLLLLDPSPQKARPISPGLFGQQQRCTSSPVGVVLFGAASTQLFHYAQTDLHPLGECGLIRQRPHHNHCLLLVGESQTTTLSLSSCMHHPSCFLVVVGHSYLQCILYSHIHTYAYIYTQHLNKS